MYRISKEFTFAMAHRLSCHKGACRNIHGHNYRVVVGVKSEKLNDEGMVIDFSDLKYILKSFLDMIDHALMINRVDKDVVEKMKEVLPFLKVIEVDYEPTAENMARMIYEHVGQALNKNAYWSIKVDYVTVYETDTSEATYSLD
jgi:6-pyruvoyltetrahydropterin/6-carboxytetrahydropterin synthase